MIHQGVAYVPEDRLRQGLCRGLSVRANVVLASLRRLATALWLPRSREVQATNQAVNQLAIRLRSIEQPVGLLSGGNQQKVVLGRWLGRDPGALILDEPTRGIDVGAKAEIYALIDRLAQQERAIVLISSDLPEIMTQSDRIGVFREGRLAAVLDPRQTTADEVARIALPTATRTGAGTEQNDQRSALLAGLIPLMRQTALLILVVAMIGWLRWKTDFRLADDLGNAALLAFCAVGAMLVILTGGIDISLGALMALSAGVAGRLWEQGHSAPVVALVALAVGAGGGALNAGLSIVGRVHPIVITLGTMSLFRGLARWWMEQDVHVSIEARQWLVASVAGLPMAAWFGLALLAITWLFLGKTVAGRELYAVGSNPAAARRVGIRQGRVWLVAFTLQGMLAGLAGFLYLARSGGLQSTSYDEMTLDAIAAVVLGGVAITGGRGGIWGVALGCLFLVTLAPACVLLHIDPNWQRTLVGGVLVFAVVLDTALRGRKE